MKHIGVLLLGTCLILGACSDTKKIAPKEGRIAIMASEELNHSNEKVRLDKTVSITQWSCSNTNTRNKIPALSLTNDTNDWKAKGGNGRAEYDLPMVSPVIINDKIYTLDSKSVLFARNINDGSELWHTELESKLQGVGLTADKNTVIALDENGTVIGVDNKGKKLWKKEFKIPFRSAPVLNNNTLYLLSANNDLLVLNAKTGSEKWHYKTSAPLTLLQGMGAPALSNDTLVVPFSNGEVIAFNATTGILLWSQDLVGEKNFDAVAGITQMSASPVIENGIVYLVGHGGKTMAVNLKTGESLWQLTKGGKTTPLISGNALFFVDNENKLVAINKKSGKLFWEAQLDKTVWKGPYLINEKLILFADNQAVSIEPKDGKMTSIEKRIEGSNPALTNNGRYCVGNNGILYHWGKIL